MPEGMLTLAWFAEAYGWPPEVVRKLDPDHADWFPVVEEAKTRARKLKDGK